jgi:hypothetical protein
VRGGRSTIWRCAAGPLPSGFAPLRTQYQGELRRQHGLRRVMWWWFVTLAFCIAKRVAAGGCARKSARWTRSRKPETYFS